MTLKVETYKTAKALGISVKQVNGMKPDDFENTIKTDSEAARVQLRKMFDGQRGGKPSMLQDLEKGTKPRWKVLMDFSPENQLKPESQHP